MIDTIQESVISLTEATRRAPGRRNLSTVWRWHMHGVRGIRLETIVCGGRRFTSAEALQRFFAATTAARDGIPATPAPRTSRQRRAAIAAAERQLDAAGI
jgi:hypothetical protein